MDMPAQKKKLGLRERYAYDADFCTAVLSAHL